MKDTINKDQLNKLYENMVVENDKETETCDVCGDKFPKEFSVKYHKNTYCPDCTEVLAGYSNVNWKDIGYKREKYREYNK